MKYIVKYHDLYVTNAVLNDVVVTDETGTCVVNEHGHLRYQRVASTVRLSNDADDAYEFSKLKDARAVAEKLNGVVLQLTYIEV